MLHDMTGSHVFQLTEEKQVISSNLDSLKAEAEAVKEQLTEMKSKGLTLCAAQCV